MPTDDRAEASPPTRVIRVIREEDGKRVTATDDYDDGVEGMAITFFPDRLRIDARYFSGGEYYFDATISDIAQIASYYREICQ
jgi:hypothetical protein